VNSLAAAVLDAFATTPARSSACGSWSALSRRRGPRRTGTRSRSLATELDVSEKVVRNAIARSELQAVKRGARWYIERDAVERWLGTAAERPAGGPLRNAFAAYGRRAA
jgi:hypothetical protein